MLRRQAPARRIRVTSDRSLESIERDAARCIGRDEDFVVIGTGGHARKAVARVRALDPRIVAAQFGNEWWACLDTSGFGAAVLVPGR